MEVEGGDVWEWSMWLKWLLLPSLGFSFLLLFVFSDSRWLRPDSHQGRQTGVTAMETAKQSHPHDAFSLTHRLHQRAVALIACAYPLLSPFTSLAFSSTSSTSSSSAPSASDGRSGGPRKRSVSSTSSSSSSSSTSSSSFSSSSPSTSPSSSPFPSLDPLRLNLQSDGVAHCYKVVSSILLSDVTSFYLQRCTEQSKREVPPSTDLKALSRKGGLGRQGLVVPSSVSGLNLGSVVVRYQGKKLSLDESLDRLGLPDMAVLDVEPDYLSLFTSIRRACDGVRDGAERELLIEAQAKASADAVIAERQLQMESSRSAISSMAEAQLRMNKEQLHMKAHIDHVDHDTQAQMQSRVHVEASLESIDVGEADLRAARLLLEAELHSVKATTSVIQSEVERLRIEYAAAVKERNEGKERLRESSGGLEVAEKEMSVWKQRAHKMQANEGKIEKIEKVIAAAAHYAERIRDNDEEMARMEEAIQEMQQQVGVREEKEKELQALKTKTKQLEKDSREAAKWRAQVKLLEKDAHEAGRWKVLVKQGKVREKTLEGQLKELHHWRQRARAFEKEVKLLRGWKRAVCEQAMREGKEAMIPEFPLEGGLDSSGGSEGLSSTGSGLGDSGNAISGSSTVDSSGSSTTTTGGRFFDLIRSGPPPHGLPGPGGPAEFFDFDSEAEFLSTLQQQRAFVEANIAVDEEDMDLHSLMGAYNAQDLQQHPSYFPADDDLSLPSTVSDDPHYPLPPSSYDPYDEDDELMRAGTSSKTIKEALARAAYPSALPLGSELAGGGVLPFAVPSRFSSVPTFYSSSTPSPFNSSIVYDEAGLLNQQTLPLSSLHPQAYHPPPPPPPPSHPFFSSWPAPSSTSPLLIIDDRVESRAASTASTASTTSLASMGPTGHPFSLSSPSPFDCGVVGGGDDGGEGASPSASMGRLKAHGGVWGVGGMEGNAGPPGLNASAVGRFSAPLVIIDDGQVKGREVQ